MRASVEEKLRLAVRAPAAYIIFGCLDLDFANMSTQKTTLNWILGNNHKHFNDMKVHR